MYLRVQRIGSPGGLICVLSVFIRFVDRSDVTCVSDTAGATPRGLSSQRQPAVAPPAGQATNAAAPQQTLYDPTDVMPSQDDVVRKTERITKKIQELLISAQEGKHNRSVAREMARMIITSCPDLKS